MKIGELLKYLNEKAPFAAAAEFDNVGLLVGNKNTEISGVCCCVDITHNVIAEAEEKGANLIVSHHPVIFDGLKTLPDWSPVASLIRKNIAAIAMHTNLDIAEHGVNQTLFELLNLNNGAPMPTAKFNKGYGIVCQVDIMQTPLSLAEYCKDQLMVDSVKYSRKEMPIRRIAICCGAGIDRDVMKFAQDNGVEAIISGDIKHNFWIEAENCGITLIDAGHFGTERCAAHLLAKMLTEALPSVSVFSADNDMDPCEYV